MASERSVSAGLPPQVWVDAQLPPALAHWLHAEHGTDAVHVEELGLHRARDPEIFSAAGATDRHVVVVTKDADFPKLLGQRGAPPQVVWVHCGNVSNQELRRVLLGAWPGVARLLAQGESLIEIRRRG